MRPTWCGRCNTTLPIRHGQFNQCAQFSMASTIRCGRLNMILIWPAWYDMAILIQCDQLNMARRCKARWIVLMNNTNGFLHGMHSLAWRSSIVVTNKRKWQWTVRCSSYGYGKLLLYQRLLVGSLYTPLYLIVECTHRFCLWFFLNFQRLLCEYRHWCVCIAADELSWFVLIRCMIHVRFIGWSTRFQIDSIECRFFRFVGCWFHGGLDAKHQCIVIVLPL